MVNYTYNAWGEIVSISGTMADTIGQVNKLRYRSYYYDSETGFYYLQSRYYDPVVKRFISPDSTDYLTANGTFDGFNLYAYCLNNPVNYSDPSGCWRVSIKTTTAGLILDFFILVVLPYVTTAFKATRTAVWAKASRWTKGIYDKAVKALSKTIYNVMDDITYKIMGKAANAAAKSITLSGLNKWLGKVLDFSIGYGIAWILDNVDSDGKSGYIRF